MENLEHTVCDWEISRSEYIEVERQVPAANASQEEKRTAQKERSRRFGIEALEGKGENLSYPAGSPTILRLYGDPTNLKYPFGRANNRLNLGRVNNARARFKQASDTYSRTASKRVIHNRIVRAQLAAGANPSFSPDDALDKLLDSALKDKLQRKGKDGKTGVSRVTFEILERQDEHQIVTGVVMDPENVDAFGNQIPDADLIERIAWGFMARFQDVGTDHATKRGDPSLVVVESFIARDAWKIGSQSVVKGAWVLSVHVKPVEVWKRVKSGALNGFSLEGVFVRVSAEKGKAKK